MPGWPLPTCCTASMARTRIRSTARWSAAVQSKALVVGLLTVGSGLLSGPRRPAGRARELDHVHDPIPSFAYSQGHPRSGATAGGLRSRRYAPRHGDQPRLRPARRDRGPASGPPAGRGHPGHRRRHRVRHRGARRGRGAEREFGRAQRGAVPHRAPAGPAPGAAAGRLRAAGGPAGAGAADQPGARVRLGRRGGRAAGRRDQHGRAGLHHPARAGQHHAGSTCRPRSAPRWWRSR